MKQIALNGKHGKGKFALVDDEDYEELMKYRWNVSSKGYATRGKVEDGVYKMIRMHRVIMKAGTVLFVDHINHNRLDNQKNNLRFCTHQENSMNQKKRKNATSKYKGVHWRKDIKKWRSRITINMKRICLGTFDSEIKAAKAYNAKAKELFGEFAHLNKI